MNVLIIEDHPISAAGSERIIEKTFQVEFIARATDGHMARLESKKHKFDLILMDVKLPNTDTLALLLDLKKVLPDGRFLMHSSMNPAVYAQQYLSQGAHGFIQKNCSEQDFVLALQLVASGNIYLPQDCAHLLSKQNGHASGNPFLELSKREFEVASHLLEGKTAKEISSIMNLEASTIASQKSRIFEKLRVTNLIDMYKLAAQYKMVE